MCSELCWCLYTESVTISPPQRSGSRPEIDCPGDTISYNCFVQSNSETVHLTWRATLPGVMPANITYDNSSEPNTEYIFHPFSIILTEYRSDEYAASTLLLTVQPTFETNQTFLECFASGLSNDSVVVALKSSGKTYVLSK